MDRRAMVLAAVLAGGLPVAARAQPRLRRIGWLGHTAIDTPDDERVHAAFGVTLPRAALLRADEVIE